MRVNKTITIDATAGRVWQIVTDLAAYPQWNPYLREALGTIAAGTRLRLLVNAPGGVFALAPRITKVNWGRAFSWLDRTGLPGLLDSHHEVSIEEVSDRQVRLVQESRVEGMLVPLLRRRLQASLDGGLGQMNRAVKRRAEDLEAA